VWLGLRPEPLETRLRLLGWPVRAARQRLAGARHAVDEVGLHLVVRRHGLAVDALRRQQPPGLVELVVQRVVLRQRPHSCRLGAQGIPLDEEIATHQRLQCLS
jgi:hypothetical protein